MSRDVCFCGMDHAKEHRKGADRERVARCERWGAPFETITEGVFVFDGVELRATQTDAGSWEASVYRAQYSEIPMLETGSVEFTGYAATERRAQRLARDFAESWLRGNQERHDRRLAESRAAREQAR